MNKLIALTTLIVLFNSVQYGSSDPICGVFEGNPEKSAMFVECMYTHFPEVVMDIMDRCFRFSFGLSAATGNFVDALCDVERNAEQARDMERCISVRRSEAEDLGREVIQSAAEETQECYMRKAGLTRTEYERLLRNGNRVADEYDYDYDE